MNERDPYLQPVGVELGFASHASLQALAALAVETVELAQQHNYHDSHDLEDQQTINIDSRYYFGHEPAYRGEGDQRVVFGETQRLVSSDALRIHAAFDELMLHDDSGLPLIAGAKDQFLATSMPSKIQPITRVHEYKLEYGVSQETIDVSQHLAVAYYPPTKVAVPPYAIGGVVSQSSNPSAELGLRNYQIKDWTARIVAFRNYIVK